MGTIKRGRPKKHRRSASAHIRTLTFVHVCATRTWPPKSLPQNAGITNLRTAANEARLIAATLTPSRHTNGFSADVFNIENHP
jgi:hypothetical protein